VSRHANQPATEPGEAKSLVKRAVDSLLPSLGQAVPSGMSPQRFQRIVLTELRKTPKLNNCTVPSVLGAVMTAAQLGLEFGPLGHAYLVPYGSQCQLIVGYKGYIDLARRSGQLKSIVARPVHERDVFDYAYGSTEYLTHKPARGDRGPVVDYYGIAILHDGGQVIHVMSPDDVQQFRKRSKASSDGPWVTDPDAMACKTVIRRMVPWLPMTVEAAQAIEADEQVINWDGREAVPEPSIIDVESEEIEPEVVDEVPA
jgi:recombination protein RecT